MVASWIIETSLPPSPMLRTRRGGAAFGPRLQQPGSAAPGHARLPAPSKLWKSPRRARASSWLFRALPVKSGCGVSPDLAIAVNDAFCPGVTRQQTTLLTELHSARNCS
eukprot:gene16997-biopygen17168